MKEQNLSFRQKIEIPDECPALNYSASGCWPSWAFHMHSVIFMSEKTAVKEDSSGEQA